MHSSHKYIYQITRREWVLENWTNLVEFGIWDFLRILREKERGGKEGSGPVLFGEHKILFAHSLKLYSLNIVVATHMLWQVLQKLHSRAPIRTNTRLHLRHKVQKDGVGSFAFNTRTVRSETLLVRFLVAVKSERDRSLSLKTHDTEKRNRSSAIW